MHAQVKQIVETLRCCSHQAFPVTPDVRKAYDSAEPFELHGCILRANVLRLLQHRIGFCDPAAGELPALRSHIPSTQAVRTPCAATFSPCLAPTPLQHPACPSLEFIQGGFCMLQSSH